MTTNITFGADYLQKLGWFFDPKFWWVRHLMFWIFRYLDIILESFGLAEETGLNASRFFKFYLVPDFVLVYFHLLVIIPYFFFKNKVWESMLLSAISILLYGAYTFHFAIGFENLNLSEFFNEFILLDVLDGIFLAGIVTGLRVTLEFVTRQEKVKEMQKSKFETELAYLKSQVSPHFLFNTLNGIAVLSEKYPDEVTSVIIKLSKVLRYQIYEGEKEQVMLRDEIEHLRNYLALESIRQSNAQTKIEVSGTSNYHMISPMLFLPFVENAIKHGRDAECNVQIDMSFDTSPEKIIFTIKNNIPDTPVLHENGGIGLKNIRRRLELLYPNQHELTIDADGKVYSVKLELEVSQKS